MELREVKRLIYGGENQVVEFKRKITFPEKVIREVVAFANASGGHLFVGVDDDKTIVGCKHVQEDDFLLQKAIRELCRPKVYFDVEHIPIGTKRSILHYYIHQGNNKPYYAFEKKQHRYGKAYLRVEDRSIQASAEIRKILKYKNTETTPFEFGSNEKILFNHLNENEKVTLREFREVSGLDQKTASAIIVRMVLANALKVIPREREDWFVPIP